MHDKFGEVMVENLKQRDCSLPSVSACASLQSQKSRYFYIHSCSIILFIS
jgi:[phosphatase 2A protein]-leucine-carboxy methyltransferase